MDDVETLIKRHEAFEKLLNSQEDKVGWSSFFSLLYDLKHLKQSDIFRLSIDERMSYHVV